MQSYDESLRHAEGELRARGFFNRGNAAFQQENYPDAVEAYEEVLTREPGQTGMPSTTWNLPCRRMSPEDQQADQQDEQQEEEDQDAEDEQEGEEQERDSEAEEQDQPMTEAQASQILESVGEAAQTFQERRGQVLVSPKPPSEFDW